ncbi:MAG TPA: dihydroorotase [Longimicrobium sp.]|jgi:dihydroorotase|uniref:dihydroorotase n=1 Tax=Longimicrobium sp. TaxID=2029185 RepID=UPI002EDACC66
MRPLLIRGGRVVDPSQKLDAVADVLLADGRVVAVGERLDAPEGAEIVDASGLVVAPGLIDVHVHLREPGQEHKETIRSGARAAAAGGFTAVVAMPNTDPPVDDPAAVGFVRAQGIAARAARVFPTGCITVGQLGEQLTEFGEMKSAGAVAVTDDGKPVVSGGMLRMALEYALTFDLPVAVHEEDPTLSRHGSMNEGIIASRLGLTGIPNAAEDVMIARDLMLAELTGGRLHVQHVSTRRGVELIREAKARGVRVTAEGTPHHFTLTDAAVEAYRTDAKMNPPLRSAADRDAVRQGVADGTLCVIATDHAPHHYDEKEQAFEDAPNGIVGLETALGLSYTELVETGLTDLPTLIERMSCAPARSMSLAGLGSLAAGSLADVTILDPRIEWTVDPRTFLSMSRNTPFGGRQLRCRAVMTIVGGKTAWQLEGKQG